MFYNNGTLLSFSVLFLPGKKVVPGGNWLTPSVKFVAGFDTTAAAPLCTPPVFPRQPQ